MNEQHDVYYLDINLLSFHTNNKVGGRQND